MTDNDDMDDKQVSVAELLARNGQRVSAPGGRRRRGVSGGISVAELTGEIPIVTDERSHYLPEAPAEAPVEPPLPSPDDRSDDGFTRDDFTRANDFEPDRFVGSFFEEDEPAAADRFDDDSDADSGFVPSWPSFAQRTAEDDTEVDQHEVDQHEVDQHEVDQHEVDQHEADETTTFQALAEPDHDDRVHDDTALDDRPDTDDADEPIDHEPKADTPPVTNMPGSKRSPARQWLGILGQGAVAIVLGALLFKGFERLWDVLPWVALVLAFFVIVGLVAVVRVLRRTDDIVSILLAVLVGGFVTLGPLAFMLSTS